MKCLHVLALFEAGFVPGPVSRGRRYPGGEGAARLDWGRHTPKRVRNTFATLNPEESRQSVNVVFCLDFQKSAHC